jgi:hypothetical protein
MGVIYIVEKTIFTSNSLIAVYKSLEKIMFVLCIFVVIFRALRAPDVEISCSIDFCTITISNMKNYKTAISIVAIVAAVGHSDNIIRH